MSFSIKLLKDENGKYIAACSPEAAEHLPNAIMINGHVESDGQVVDLSVRCDGIVANASRRDYKVV